MASQIKLHYRESTKFRKRPVRLTGAVSRFGRDRPMKERSVPLTATAGLMVLVASAAIPVARGPAAATDENLHSLWASYYSTKEFDAILTLNNKGPGRLPVTLAFHSLDGRRTLTRTDSVAGNSAKRINLNDLLAGEPAFREGSLRVEYAYAGDPLVLGSQVVLEDEPGGIVFDEQLSNAEAAWSQRLEGLWWLPTPRSAFDLVLCNVSDSMVPVTLELVPVAGGVEPVGRRQALLAPRETRLVRLPAARGGPGTPPAQPSATAGGITVTHDGPPGAILA